MIMAGEAFYLNKASVDYFHMMLFTHDNHDHHDDG